MKRLLVSFLSLAVIGGGAFAFVNFAPALFGTGPVERISAVAEQAPPQTPQPTLVAQAAAQENPPAMATTTTTTTTTHGGWTVSCNTSGTPPVKVCSASYRVFNKQNNQNLLVWVFGRNRENKLLAEFMTLTDVQIEPGVVLTLDGGTPIKAGYVECTTRGCKARLEMTPNLVRQMKAAKKARLDMTRLDGQVIQFSMDIPGIDLALGELGA